MLIVAYVINSALVSAVSRQGGVALSCAGISLIVLFLGLTILNVLCILFQFREFGVCTRNVIILWFTSVTGVLIHLLVLVKTREDASVFTSSLVFSYCLFL